MNRFNPDKTFVPHVSVPGWESEPRRAPIQGHLELHSRPVGLRTWNSEIRTFTNSRIEMLNEVMLSLNLKISRVRYVHKNGSGSQWFTFRIKTASTPAHNQSHIIRSLLQNVHYFLVGETWQVHPVHTQHCIPCWYEGSGAGISRDLTLK